MKQVIPHHECLDALRQALADAGQPLDHIIIDDQLHRYDAPGEKRGRKSCWYVARWLSNDRLSCNFGDNHKDPAGKGGHWQSWDNQTIDPGELQRLQQEMEDRKVEADHQQAKIRKRAAKRGRAIWKSLNRDGNHPYLERKGVPGLGVRYGTDNYGPFIAVPVRGPDGALRGIQRIYDGPVRDGRDKHIDSGVEKTGGYHSIGRIETDQPTIYIHEGYATGASGYLATHAPTVIAFDAGNIPHVAQALRKKYPKATLVIAADNDIREPGSKDPNTGVVFARKAAQSFNCRVAIPEWQGKKCDFNDLHQWAGLDEVRRQLEQDGGDRPKRGQLIEGIEPLYTGTFLPAAEASARLDGLQQDFIKSPRNMAIEGAAGLGKSTRIHKILARDTRRVEIYIPGHKLGAEVIGYYGPDARIARGRDHIDDEGPACHKHEAITALNKRGIKRVFGMMCETKFKGGEKIRCEHFGSCPNTRAHLDKPRVKIMAHEYLPLDRGDLDKEKPDLAIIDESFLTKLAGTAKWPAAKLLELDDIVSDAIRLLMQNRPIKDLLTERPDAIDALEAILKDWGHETLGIMPGMPVSQILSALNRLPPQDYPYRAAHSVMEALKGNRAIWYVPHSSKGAEDQGYIHAKWIEKPSRLNGVPVLILDANVQINLLRKSFPEIEHHAIKVQRNARMVQIYDTAMSHRRLKGIRYGEEDPEKEEARAERLKSRFELRAKQEPGISGIITGQDFEKRFTPTKGRKTGHFNNLRGQNQYEDCDWGMVIGRNQPSPYDVEALARAFYPGEDLDLPGTYDDLPAGYRMRDGRKVGVMAQYHRDPRVNEILQMMREDESEQAIDRYRLIYCEHTKTIYIVSNLPLDIEVDELITLDEFLGDYRMMAGLEHFGGWLPLAKRELHKARPDLFPTAGSANQWILKVMGTKRNKLSITKSTHNFATYRLEGQRGPNSSRLITIHGDLTKVRRQIEAHYGKAVKSLDWDQKRGSFPIKDSDRDACLWDYLTGSLNRLAELPAEVISQAPVVIAERERREKALAEFLDFLFDLSERYVERAAIQEYEAYAGRDEAEVAIEGDMEAEIAARFEELFNRPYPVDLVEVAA